MLAITQNMSKQDGCVNGVPGEKGTVKPCGNPVVPGTIYCPACTNMLQTFGHLQQSQPAIEKQGDETHHDSK